MNRARLQRRALPWVQVAAGALCIWLVSVWTAGISKAQRPFANPKTLMTRVVQYELRARLDPASHEVTGEGTIRFRNYSDKELKTLRLHLYLNAFANEKTVFMRDPLPGFRGAAYPEVWGGIDLTRVYHPKTGSDLWKDAVKHTPGDPEDATDIELSLPEPLGPGDDIELEVAWVSRLPSVTHRTGFSGSFHMVAQWFPKLAKLEPDGTWAHFPFHRLSEFYADFGTYDVSIDVPEDFVVGASGVPMSPKGAPRKGEKRLRFEAHGVHDFAFTAWDGFAEKSASGYGGIELTCLYPRGLDGVADRELDAVSSGLRLLTERYGPYPYKRLTIVHPPRVAGDAGGMEYPMLITTGGHWLGPRFGVGAIDAVTVHELAHQWFYGLLASNEFRWPFLDEGMTTYASSDALEQIHPDASAFDGLGLSLSLWAINRAGGVADHGDTSAMLRADEFESGGAYGALVYSKTATLIETLHRVYGRERMVRALAYYAATQRFEHPTPEDLFSAVQRHAGKDAADNLRKGLAGATVDYRVGDPDDGPVVATRHGELAFDVEVEVVDTDGGRRRLKWPASETSLPIPGDVAAVVIDPELRVLIDTDLTNNARRLGRARIAPRLWHQLAGIAQLASAWVAP